MYGFLVELLKLQVFLDFKWLSIYVEGEFLDLWWMSSLGLWSFYFLGWMMNIWLKRWRWLNFCDKKKIKKLILYENKYSWLFQKINNKQEHRASKRKKPVMKMVMVNHNGDDCSVQPTVGDHIKDCFFFFITTWPVFVGGCTMVT